MPEYSVWPKDDDESEARRIEAMDSKEAAELWAKLDDWDSVEYSIARGNDAVVMVRLKGYKPEEWIVMGESEPVYRATRA